MQISEGFLILTLEKHALHLLRRKKFISTEWFLVLEPLSLFFLGSIMA